eukprot:GHRQ01000427.1.p1 GENE.GHRQ01000427.1~~GHRQ01000427.1.p1  ORF type:complete len:324 (+),score=93.15 GHRQ01000427.1:307-1278(+)
MQGDTMAVTFAIFSVALLAWALGAAAHGGTLHTYPGTPSGRDYIRTKIASCDSWAPASGAVKYSLVNSAANVSSSSSSSAKPLVKGNATVWTYLYKNCSLAEGDLPSAGVEVNLLLTADGKPVGGMVLDGVAMTGTCASGGGSPYYFDPAATPIDNAENLLWFHNYTVPANGSVWGNGANDGRVSTLPQGGIRSIMLVKTSTGESVSCCDLTVAGDADTDWEATLMGKGEACDDDHGHAAKANGTAALDHTGHAGMAGHDHAAMMNETADLDHADHAGHDHENVTTLTQGAAAPAASAKSSASVKSGSAAVVAAVVLAVAAFL